MVAVEVRTAVTVEMGKWWTMDVVAWKWKTVGEMEVLWVGLRAVMTKVMVTAVVTVRIVVGVSSLWH